MGESAYLFLEVYNNGVRPPFISTPNPTIWFCGNPDAPIIVPDTSTFLEAIETSLSTSLAVSGFYVPVDDLSLWQVSKFINFHCRFFGATYLQRFLSPSFHSLRFPSLKCCLLKFPSSLGDFIILLKFLFVNAFVK